MSQPLRAAHEPPAFEIERPQARSNVVVLCDHASNRVPASLGRLGLSNEQRDTHIAWDPGAATMARTIGRVLDATVVLSGYSRLVIDCNRPTSSSTSIPTRSADIVIPRNQDLSREECHQRAEEFFWPYHRAIEALLRDRAASGMRTAILSVHSFTPEPLHGPRPWHAGMVYGRDRRLAGLLYDVLARDRRYVIGDNQPYQVTDEGDYDIPRYAEQGGLPGVLIEVRQDELTTTHDATTWGERLANAYLTVESTLWNLPPFSMPAGVNLAL